MSVTVNDLLLLAAESEGIPADHIASKLAVPLGILFFCGSVYLLLWSNYGARKGAAIYGTAFFAFNMMLGVFWWFAAPGGLVAGGPRHYPGQEAGRYQGEWFAFEQGSERAGLFPATNDASTFQPIPEHVASMGGLERFFHGGDGYVTHLQGLTESAGEQMVSLFLPTDEAGAVRIGANRRQEYLQAAGDPGEGEERAQPFFTATAGEMRVARSNGALVTASDITVNANFVGPDGNTRTETVDTQTVFAFRDPGALWFPSAVWTGASLLLFLGSLWWLDRLEQREKREQEQVEEPEDMAVPIAQ